MGGQVGGWVGGCVDEHKVYMHVFVLSVTEHISRVGGGGTIGPISQGEGGGGT